MLLWTQLLHTCNIPQSGSCELKKKKQWTSLELRMAHQKLSHCLGWGRDTYLSGLMICFSMRRLFFTLVLSPPKKRSPKLFHICKRTFCREIQRKSLCWCAAAWSGDTDWIAEGMDLGKCDISLNNMLFCCSLSIYCSLPQGFSMKDDSI